MFNKDNRGFTLIELLVVVAIIGLLSSVILASLNSARKKARDAQRITELNEFIKAQEMYYDDHGGYAGLGDGGGVHLHPNCSSDIKNDLVNGGYLPQIIGDPGDDGSDCGDDSDDNFFYGWDSSHCCEGWNCVSINRLETPEVAERLKERFGKLHYVTGGGDANIGTGDDFNYCFNMR